MQFLKDTECTRETPVVLGHKDTEIYGNGIRIQPRVPGRNGTKYEQESYLEELLPLEEYDRIIVLFSGGKDSVAAFYKLLEMGVPKDRIELWHHDIDGKHPTRRMDWPVTQAYVKAFAEANGVKLRFSWRVNGFWGEVYRIGASWPVQYEDNGVKTCKLSPKQLRSQELREKAIDDLELKAYGYRMKFPAKSGDLSTRWCSAYLKIMVSESVVRNLVAEAGELEDIGKRHKFPAKGSADNGRYCSGLLKINVGESVIANLEELKDLGSDRHKFPAKGSCQSGRWCSGALKAQVQDGVTSNLVELKANIKLLVVSGERRGESANRANYNEMEVHRTNALAKAKRLVHQWRPVIDYSERDVWEVLKRHNVNPHPCYRAGWNRCSCMMCIFSLPKHWAGIKELYPEDFDQVRQDEVTLGFTLDNKKTLDQYVEGAESCVYWADEKAIEQLKTGTFGPADVFLEPGSWTFPAGAFHGSEGGPC